MEEEPEGSEQMKMTLTSLKIPNMSYAPKIMSAAAKYSTPTVTINQQFLHHTSQLEEYAPTESISKLVNTIQFSFQISTSKMQRLKSIRDLTITDTLGWEILIILKTILHLVWTHMILYGYWFTQQAVVKLEALKSITKLLDIQD